MLVDCAIANPLEKAKVPRSWPPPIRFVPVRKTRSYQVFVAGARPWLASVQPTKIDCPALAVAGTTTFVTAKSGYGASVESAVSELVLLLSAVPFVLYSNTLL